MELRKLLLTATLAFFALSVGTAFAQEDLKEKVLEGCAAEKETYCSQVTPGQGRLLACFYAHEDKLSGWCSHTLYSASQELKVAVSTMNYLGNVCRDDILSNCAMVEMGEGRVLECLKESTETVSEKCTKGIAAVFK